MLAALTLASTLAAGTPALERTPLDEPMPEIAIPCAGSPTGLARFGPVVYEEEVEAIEAMLARKIEPLDFVQTMIALDAGSMPLWRELWAMAHVCPGPQV